MFNIAGVVNSFAESINIVPAADEGFWGKIKTWDLLMDDGGVHALQSRREPEPGRRKNFEERFVYTPPIY